MNLCDGLLCFLANHEHLKYFRNVDCVVTSHNKDKDTRANLKTAN